MVETRPRLTEEEFLALPDDGRKYELVDGEAKEVPTGAKHGDLAITLILLLAGIGRRLGRLFDSSTGFRMATGNIRSPDVSYVRRDRLPAGELPIGFLEGAPDLAVEIISPSEDPSEMARKVEEYFESGAENVWQVFPGTHTVVIFDGPGEARTLSEADTLEAGAVLPGFQCRVSDIFA